MTEKKEHAGNIPLQALRIGELAHEALIEEVITTPKPGLVDLYSNGAHTDMDADTFRRSAEALRPFFVLMAQRGMEARGTPEEMFASIRKTGMDAEQAMYAATGGVNTHKGIIFTFGVFCAAAGRCLCENRELTPENLLAMQQAMTVRILTRELEQIRDKGCAGTPDGTSAGQEKTSESHAGTKAGQEKTSDSHAGTKAVQEKTSDSHAGTGPGQDDRSGKEETETVNRGKEKAGSSGARITHGERNLLRYGTSGIRGEAIAGYPGVFRIGLPVLQEGLRRGEDWNLVKLHTLASLMAVTEDSNILSRGGPQELKTVHEEMEEFLAAGGAYRAGAVEILKEMDRDYIRRNCSPGGCADLLATVVFISSLSSSGLSQ